ncbi:jg5359 [Pararge aegeria aegeria]|uniref:Jg5359 protein n=1 Tax=Pararge aegeria aegeria TaxID=348720 RepID=A0A8S4QPK5_9NEOP|nr:jg5359 [Pararge aegeria aegeria]
MLDQCGLVTSHAFKNIIDNSQGLQACGNSEPLRCAASEVPNAALWFFCEDVISQKEAAERVREEAPDAHPLRRRRVGRRQRQFAARQLLLGGGG